MSKSTPSSRLEQALPDWEKKALLTATHRSPHDGSYYRIAPQGGKAEWASKFLLGKEDWVLSATPDWVKKNCTPVRSVFYNEIPDKATHVNTKERVFMHNDHGQWRWWNTQYWVPANKDQFEPCHIFAIPDDYRTVKSNRKNHAINPLAILFALMGTDLLDSEILAPCGECDDCKAAGLGKEEIKPPVGAGATKPELVKVDNSAPAILDKAAGHMRDRAATYDSPQGERSMAKTVAAFNAHHGTNLSEEQGWHFMSILKQVRFFTTESYHADSAEDNVAYAGLMAEARAMRQNKA